MASFLDGMNGDFYIVSSRPSRDGERFYIEHVEDIMKLEVEADESVDLSEYDDFDVVGFYVGVVPESEQPYPFSQLEDAIMGLRSIKKAFERTPELAAQFDTTLGFPFIVERVRCVVEKEAVSDSDLMIAEVGMDIGVGEILGNDDSGWTTDDDLGEYPDDEED